MEKFITDERTGLCYELVGDYYLIAGEDKPEGRPIGVWGQRHLRYIRKHKVSLYAELLTTGKLNDYPLHPGTVGTGQEGMCGEKQGAAP